MHHGTCIDVWITISTVIVYKHRAYYDALMLSNFQRSSLYGSLDWALPTSLINHNIHIDGKQKLVASSTSTACHVLFKKIKSTLTQIIILMPSVRDESRCRRPVTHRYMSQRVELMCASLLGKLPLEFIYEILLSKIKASDWFLYSIFYLSLLGLTFIPLNAVMLTRVCRKVWRKGGYMSDEDTVNKIITTIVRGAIVKVLS